MKPSIPTPADGSSPFQGPGLSRRAFLELGTSGLVMSWFLPSRLSAAQLGAVAAIELDAHRTGADVLPSFVALNTGSAMVGSGYLPSLYAPFSVQPTSTGLTSLTHPDGTARFALRWDELNAVDAALRSGAPLGKDAADVVGFYTQAKTLMDAPDVNALFSYTTDESTR